MSGLPTVSVVVPCLNRARFLVPTLESILRQDYPRIECIVVDGGSTDGTTEILRGYSERIQWVSEPDDGHADAINKGWKMSGGEVLAWLNADDLYVVPHAIGQAVEHLQADARADVVYGDYALISEDGKWTSRVIRSRDWDLEYAVTHCHHIIPQPASFIRRSVLERVGWLDPEFRNGKDHELWLRIGLVGALRHLPLHLAYARTGPGLSQQLDMAASKVDLTRKFFRHPDLPHPFDSPRYRRRALSNAHLVGGLYIWDGSRRFGPSLQYWWRAVKTSPVNGPHVILQAARRVLSSLLPRSWRRGLRRVADSMKRNSPGSRAS